MNWTDIIETWQFWALLFAGFIVIQLLILTMDFILYAFQKEKIELNPDMKFSLKLLELDIESKKEQLRKLKEEKK